MKASEKEQLVGTLIKVWDKVMRYHGMKRSDAIKVVMRAAYSLVRYCVREGYEGCKKNSRKTDKVTLSIMRDYIDPQDEQDWQLKDDEENESTDQTD